MELTWEDIKWIYEKICYTPLTYEPGELYEDVMVRHFKKVTEAFVKHKSR